MTSTQTDRKVAVLGAGAWGTALAKVLADKGDPVQMYCRRPYLVAQSNGDHVNGKYLRTGHVWKRLTAAFDSSIFMGRVTAATSISGGGKMNAR